jgi:hypothetical protein
LVVGVLERHIIHTRWMKYIQNNKYEKKNCAFYNQNKNKRTKIIITIYDVDVREKSYINTEVLNISNFILIIPPFMYRLNRKSKRMLRRQWIADNLLKYIILFLFFCFLIQNHLWCYYLVVYWSIQSCGYHQKPVVA